MKKLFINLTIAILLMFGISSISSALSVLTVDTANAKEYQVNITMDYQDPPTDLAGYNVYINNVLADTVYSQTPVTSWGTTVDMDDGNNTFEVTSFDTAGQESPKSNSESFDPPPITGPQIVDIAVTEAPDPTG